MGSGWAWSVKRRKKWVVVVMIWLRKLECQSWGSGGKGVSVVGVGVVRSVKKRWLREGWRHARKTVLLDWGSGISSRRCWVRWRNWRVARWRNWWQNAGLPMGAPRRRMSVVILGVWVGVSARPDSWSSRSLSIFFLDNLCTYFNKTMASMWGKTPCAKTHEQ